MKQEIRTAWADRLDAGTEQQVTGGLCRRVMPDSDPHGTGLSREEIAALPAGHCCLGVLSKMAVEAGVEGIRLNPETLYFEQLRDPSLVRPGEEPWEEIGGFLPERVRIWAGLQNHDPHIGTETAAQWNDGEQLPFPEIAAKIREFDPR